MYWFRRQRRDPTAGRDRYLPPVEIAGVRKLPMGWNFASWQSWANIVRSGLAAALGAALLACLLTRPVAAQVCGTPPCGPGGGGQPLAATLVQSLDFGNVGNSPSLPGAATVDPATGTKVVTGGATDMGGVHAPAIFDIRGERLRAFTITLPAQITIAGPGGSTTTIDNFTSSPVLAGVLDSTGKATVSVGATLHVSGPLANGAYTNLFDITVTYQ